MKVYAAYHQAVHHKGRPTVILAKTVKGFGMGEAGEGQNITHQKKKLDDDDLKHFRDRFHVPISDEDLARLKYYKPADDSEEMQYLKERRDEARRLLSRAPATRRAAGRCRSSSSSRASSRAAATASSRRRWRSCEF